MVSFPKPDDVANEIRAIPFLVVLMVCEVLGESMCHLWRMLGSRGSHLLGLCLAMVCVLGR